MNKEELNKLVTIEDLEGFRKRLLLELKEVVKGRANEREFYSPKEFAYKTSMKYSTVVYHCKVGRLKARQEAPNCLWLIHKSELERYLQEAN